MAATEGIPLLRPLWLEFPTDDQTFELTDQFMFGGSVIISPKLKPSSSKEEPLSGVGNDDNLFTRPPPEREPRSVYLPP